ncbi:dihydroxyacetone kinase family protein [Undibacter mobilis]|uniref:Dihydroxyacetone kinase subunit DhaK n=1 Tax=Undibacter mobilis TaxID=2292256 RepID=A0A371BBR2_9BRAD|nr:dihydroxyacetone kinase family protein [Undibacter mobilis]RDV05008.1 dihydroxyacetone kinase subunit DhaK [Undibacter mobilis]
MKKLINDPRDVVREMLEGLVQVSPGLALLEGETVVMRAELPPDPASRPVAVLSGGGSGHEPAHAGYVGPGMLSAAIAGDVFTSPSVDAVHAAIRATAGPAGAVLIVKNYTGDRLNFGLAAELARQDGIPVEIVVVADDVALRDTVTRERRRGIAGTILVHKVAGAAAGRGHTLATVAALARRAADRVGTMGVGLGSCIVPSAGVPSFQLGADEIEFGLGIHGEKGVRRTSMSSADAIVKAMLEPLLDEMKPAKGEPVALLVNGLGATTPMELAIVTRAAFGELESRGLVVGRAWTGALMTALEMPGCSISLLLLDGELTGLLDDPTQAMAWPGSGKVAATPRVVAAPPVNKQPEGVAVDGPLSQTMRRVVDHVANALENAERHLTDLDSRAGDGDLGASMARGAAALRTLPAFSFASPAPLLFAIGETLRRVIAGSSGPFYATALLRASKSLSGADTPDEQQWRAAFARGVAAIAELGGGREGDRTMLDALIPASQAWLDGSWPDAVRAAEGGALRTADMYPRLGRASYLGDRAVGVPDGGAVAVTIWMAAISEALG